MTQLSEHFTLAEFTASQTAARRGIDNTPDAATVQMLKNTAFQMEKVRSLLGVSINVSSAYRSPTLNRAIGGSATSAHCRGEAVDFTAPSFGTPKEICKLIEKSGIKFDQLIYERTWVHIAFDSSPRQQVLTAHFGGGATQYSKGIV